MCSDYSKILMLHFCASNDVNGNPQRLYALVSNCGIIAVWDEGYHGSDAVPGIWREEAYNAARHNISVRKYKQLLKANISPAYAHLVPGFEHLKEYA